MPGGRPKGSRNKPKQRLIALLEAKYPGYNPVVELARIAHETDDEQLRFNAHKEVAQYVTPKLKAVETTVETVEKLRIAWDDGSDRAEGGDSVPGKAAAG